MPTILDSIRKELERFSFQLDNLRLVPIIRNGIKIQVSVSFGILYEGEKIGVLELSLLDGKVDYRIRTATKEKEALEILNYISSKYQYSLDSFTFLPFMVSFSVKDLEKHIIVGFLTVKYEGKLKLYFEKTL